MKSRLIVDMLGFGVKVHTMTPSFHMVSLDDLVQFSTPGCFIATAEITSYYNNFPLAESARHLLAVFWLYTFLYWIISFGSLQHLGDLRTAPSACFPLLCGAGLQADPSRLQILVSDAAGDDGMG